MDGDQGVAPPFYTLLILPQGAIQGFVNVTLGYILAHAGVSVAAIATIVSVNNIPSTRKFIGGPVIDLTLTPRRWYLIALAAVCLSFLALGAVSPTRAGVPALTVVALFAGVAFSLLGSCLSPIVGRTAACAERGAIAGWQQAGNLGGIGLGGGAGLWLATGWGLPTASVALALASIFAAVPILYVRTPRRVADETVATRAAATLASVKQLVRSRSGILALIFNLVPLNLGVAVSLFGAMAIDWHASAGLVGLVTGFAGSVASALGCVAGGLLAGRIGSRAAVVATGIGCAAAEILMATMPHTPAGFAVFVIANSLLLGGGWAATQAVVYDELGVAGGGTVGSILSSASNIPVVAFTALLGFVQASHGSDGLLIAEAGLAAIAIAGLALLHLVWRPLSTIGATT